MNQGQAAGGGAKESFEIGRALAAIEVAVRPFPKAALFELAEAGYRSVFEQLIACLISIRTRDEVSLPVARRLFERARTPAEVAALTVDEIDALIGLATFHEAKARQIRAIAERTAIDYGDDLPADFDVLTAFAGVGPKCASLALGIAAGQSRIGVDIHVHRVTNRWGYVATRSPEQTMIALEAQLPREYWIAINRLLVPFGKHICTGARPRCSTCPVLAMCQQRGVTDRR